MHYGIILGLLLLSLALGFCLGSMTLDDPFVTYRYAHNLRAGLGLVYNPGERVMSTTAPLYAVVLGIGAFFTDNLPALSNGLNVLALWVGGCFLYLWCAHQGQPDMGWIAAALYVSSPLLWLSLGFETAFYLALVLGAFCLYSEQRLVPAAALLALALLTRGDGILPALVIGTHYALTQRRIPWRAVVAYLTIAAPFLLYLTVSFGSPFPVTLAAKSAQAQLGVTGFYAHTTFLQGIVILVRAYVQQSPLYVLGAVCAAFGLVVTSRREHWLWPVLGWAALYLAGYVALGVAPYHWYYIPLLPALALLTGAGAHTLANWSASRLRTTTASIAIAVALGLLLIAPHIISNAQSRQALLHPGSVPPESPAYKVLPEAKVLVYRQVGEWLKDNTPPDALIGVTEVGVMGYYSQRRMVDFLGLLRPAVAQALRRGDMAWALLYYQPDYVVLTRVNPLYSYDLRNDEWFKLAYRPVQVFEDVRFWGGPVTVYQRQTPLAPQLSNSELPSDAVPVHIRFGDGIELQAYQVDRQELHPGDILNVTFFWKCLATLTTDYTVFVHILGQHELVVAQQDTYPCLGACPTRGWKVGQTFVDSHLLAIPETAFIPDQAQLEVGLYQQASGQRLPASTAQGQSLGDNARFQPLPIVSTKPSSIPNAMRINLGDQITLVGYNLDQRAIQPGQSVRLTLYWQALKPMQTNYSVFTHLLAENGQRVAQMDSWPQHGQAPTSTWHPGSMIQDEYELNVPISTPSGVYSIQIGIYLAETGSRLPVLDVTGQAQADHLVLSAIRVE